jgi:prepilin peptidase CpaA
VTNLQCILITAFLFIFVTVVCYCDIRFNKIYNWLTLPFLGIGLFINTLTNGMDGTLISLTGILTGFSILLLPFMWEWIGGGDVKFLAAAGSFLGPSAVAYSAFYGLILYGIASLIYLSLQGKLKAYLQQLSIAILTRTLIIDHYGRLPLGLFLGMGTICYWLYLNFLV